MFDIKKFNNIIYFYFSIFLTFIIVISLLGYGYIFSLDGLTGIQINVNEVSISYSTMLFEYIYKLFSQVTNVFITQKIYMILIFFGMLYLPLTYFPNVFTNKKSDSKNIEFIKYVVAIFYTVNPFVYERFLAGQWAVLAGYALLWPFVYYLIEFVRGGEVKDFQKLLIATFLVGAVSFHFLIMCFVILFFTFGDVNFFVIYSPPT